MGDTVFILGIFDGRRNLEDLILKHLDEEAYNLINRKINQRRDEREGYINTVTSPIVKELKKAKNKDSNVFIKPIAYGETAFWLSKFEFNHNSVAILNPVFDI